MFIPILLAGGVRVWVWSQRVREKPQIAPLPPPTSTPAPDFGASVPTRFTERVVMPESQVGPPPKARELDEAIFFADLSAYPNLGAGESRRVIWLLAETLGQEGGSDVFTLEWLGSYLSPTQNRFIPIAVIRWNKPYSLGLRNDPIPGQAYIVRSMGQRYFNERLLLAPEAP